MIAGERQIDACQFAVSVITLELFPVEKIGLAVSVAKKQPASPIGTGGGALLNERPERRDSGSRSDHDDRRIAILRQLEMFVVMQEHRHRLPHPNPLGRVGGADSLAITPVALVTQYGDGQVHLTGMRQRAGGNRVKPRGDLPQDTAKITGRHSGHRKVGQQVDHLASPKVFLQPSCVLRVKQRLDFVGLRELIIFFEDTFGETGDVEFIFQRLAKRSGVAVGKLNRHVGIESAGLHHVSHEPV